MLTYNNAYPKVFDDEQYRTYQNDRDAYVDIYLGCVGNDAACK